MCSADAYTPAATGAAKMLNRMVVSVARFPSLLIILGIYRCVRKIDRNTPKAVNIPHAQKNDLRFFSPLNTKSPLLDRDRSGHVTVTTHRLTEAVSFA